MKTAVMLVFDRATGLLWQKSGSDNVLTYQQAQEYVDTLNREVVCWFSRLATANHAGIDVAAGTEKSIEWVVYQSGI